ncbi:hypothetical protein PENTCL1PPCAC_7809, partial [Pristionchus entomophagus]
INLNKNYTEIYTLRVKIKGENEGGNEIEQAKKKYGNENVVVVECPERGTERIWHGFRIRRKRDKDESAERCSLRKSELLGRSHVAQSSDDHVPSEAGDLDQAEPHDSHHGQRLTQSFRLRLRDHGRSQEVVVVGKGQKRNGDDVAGDRQRGQHAVNVVDSGHEAGGGTRDGK